MCRILPGAITLLALLLGCSITDNQPVLTGSANVQDAVQAPNSPAQETPGANPQGKLAQNAPHAETGFLLDPLLFDSASMPFVPHAGSGPYQSYLAMNLPFEPVDKLRSQLERELGITLNHRGEAHITIITPPEFERLSTALSIQKINSTMAKKIQNRSFRIECIGKTTIEIDGTLMSTFYLVLDSKDLIELRTEIAHMYASSGGVSPAYLAAYHPHITLGFTHRDLHASDGAMKNSQACFKHVLTH